MQMYDKLILQIVFACTMLFGVLAFSLVFFVSRYKNKVHQHMLERQRLLFELEMKELNMSFKERELILDEVSKDIHDNIGQIIYVIRRNLYTVEEIGTNEEQLELIQYIAELTDRVVKEITHIGRSLDRDFIKARGLYRMLEYDVEHINSMDKIRCYIITEGHRYSISPEAQLLVYRIAQEAIHNVLQHAEATDLEVKLYYRENELEMTIRDDGRGFHVEITRQEETAGLRNMYQRARLLNGSLSINSDTGKGCIIKLLFPTSIPS